MTASNSTPDRAIADRAIAAYVGTLAAAGITPPNARTRQYADAITLVRAAEREAHNAAFRLTDAAARIAAVTAIALWGEFVYMWERNARAADLAAVADALADVNDRATWQVGASA
jgi:hypothetical protein